MEPLTPAAIERLRAELVTSTQVIVDVELGPNPNHLHDLPLQDPAPTEEYSIAWLARVASVTPAKGMFLFELSRRLSPATVVELGTCIGVSTAYLSAGSRSSNPSAKVSSFDAGIKRLEVARRVLDSLGASDGVELVLALHERALRNTIPNLAPIDLAFVDSDHRERSTVDYFNSLVPLMHPNGVMCFDDIDWSNGMRRAWGEIERATRPPALTTTWGAFGLWVSSPAHWVDSGCDVLLTLAR